jgi:hypothetical protein
MASAQESPGEPEEEAPEPLRMQAPSWSIQDDERDDESGASVVPGEVGVPSWSILDRGEPETPPEAVPLSALDSELFIEEEEALEEEASMLSQIPVEEIAISEEPLEIEIEVVEDPFPAGSRSRHRRWSEHPLPQSWLRRRTTIRLYRPTTHPPWRTRRLRPARTPCAA